MKGKTVEPSSTAKLLGVIFDHELRWKDHVQQAIKRAIKVSIALGRLRYLRPEQMRQLYQACVTPAVDYASTVWHDPQSSQCITHAIPQTATEVQAKEIVLHLQRIPGHCDNPGNDAANPGKTYAFFPSLTRKRRLIETPSAPNGSGNGQHLPKAGHLRKIDSTLPAAYTRRLYGSLPTFISVCVGIRNMNHYIKI
jgi:hypothetical protein